MNYSFQKRLTSILLISLICAFTLIWLIINFSVRYLIYDYIYSRLNHDNETLLAVVVKNTEQLDKKLLMTGAIYQKPFSGHYFEITEDGSLFRSRSLWDQTLSYDKSSVNSKTHQQISGPMDQSLLLLVKRFKKDNKTIIIAVAEDVSEINNSIQLFRYYFSACVIFILILLITLQIFGLKKELKPLKQLHYDLKRLKLGQINELTTTTSSEFTPLKDEINLLEKTLVSRLTRHRNALSDLAHALKKPLTVLHQLSKDNNLDNLPEIKTILEHQCYNTKHLINGILNRARLAGSITSKNNFNFNSDLIDLIDTLKMMYRDKNIKFSKKIETTIQGAFDREDILELLGNLLDNACKWCRNEVSISIIQKENLLTIVIVDDGAGIDHQDIKMIQQRGTRLDESIEGHGLGLGIVSDIIDYYKGEILYSTSEKLGGLKVSIILPFMTSPSIHINN